MLQINQTLRLASSWLDDVKSLDHRKVLSVERGKVASTFEGGRGHDQVVSSDHFARRLQTRSQARVSKRGLLGVLVEKERSLFFQSLWENCLALTVQDVP
jgi:hypothetical protein